ncbi:MAG TPA: phosphoribosylanthranilate isomerase [Flavobacterium sp.]|nr:phosphoribosylanthranilate isomerase [Flavobacterium sp.]
MENKKRILFKICGMKHPPNCLEASLLETDLMGFIFYEKSPRFFSGKMPQLPKEIKKTGVFVNASYKEIDEKIKTYGLDLVQLHGNETPALCKRINNKVPAIKAFQMDDNFDFAVLELYKEACSYFLFDTKGKNYGGSGQAFDWSVLRNYRHGKPYFLSGGLGLENVLEIKDFLAKDYASDCHGVDLNSKFEIEPGQKEIKKLDEFMKLLK